MSEATRTCLRALAVVLALVMLEVAVPAPAAWSDEPTPTPEESPLATPEVLTPTPEPTARRPSRRQRPSPDRNARADGNAQAHGDSDPDPTSTPSPTPSPTPTPFMPNMILIQSDDHGWPYYGFMQRWLRKQLAAGALEIVSDPEDPRANVGYDHPEILLPEDHQSSTPSTDCGIDDPGCEPCVGTRCTPPIHQIITPALDDIAEKGNYFPVAHTPASLCKPSLAAIMTGLHLGDFRRAQGNQVTSPTLPEWLPGFDQHTLPLSPTTYLSHGPRQVAVRQCDRPRAR